MPEESPLERELSAIKAVMELPEENRHSAVRDLMLRVLLKEDPNSAVVEILNSIIREKVAVGPDPDERESGKPSATLSVPANSGQTKEGETRSPNDLSVAKELSEIIGDNSQFSQNQWILTALALLEIRLGEEGVKTERITQLLTAASKKIANIGSHLKQLREKKDNPPVRAVQEGSSKRYRYSLTTSGLKTICRETGIS